MQETKCFNVSFGVSLGDVFIVCFLKIISCVLGITDLRRPVSGTTLYFQWCTDLNGGHRTHSSLWLWRPAPLLVLILYHLCTWIIVYASFPTWILEFLVFPAHPSLPSNPYFCSFHMDAVYSAGLLSSTISPFISGLDPLRNFHFWAKKLWWPLCVYYGNLSSYIM